MTSQSAKHFRQEILVLFFTTKMQVMILMMNLKQKNCTIENLSQITLISCVEIAFY